MNKINDYNWKELADLAQHNVENKLSDWRFATVIKGLPLDHILPIFSSLTLYRSNTNSISATKTLKNIPDEVKTEDSTYTKQTVNNIIKFFYYIPRSNVINGALTKHTRLASYTPLFLYAHKLHNNVPYEKWDKNDQFLKYLLGRQLEWLLDDFNWPELTSEEINQNREALLKVPSSGVIKELTSYKCNTNKIRIGDNYIIVPKQAIRMLLQMWICNSNIRDTSGSMILDPLDWDRIPPALDTIMPKKKEESPWGSLDPNFVPMGVYKKDVKKASDGIPWD